MCRYLSLILMRNKSILGDTCSRVAQMKQQVARSDINVYNGKSTFLSVDGLSLARPSPSLARFWKSWDLEIQKFRVQNKKIKLIKIRSNASRKSFKIYHGTLQWHRSKRLITGGSPKETGAPFWPHKGKIVQSRLCHMHCSFLYHPVLKVGSLRKTKTDLQASMSKSLLDLTLVT